MNINQAFYPEIGAGGFSRNDGTLQFYMRVNALLSPSMTVMDLGAGRGSISDEATGERAGSFRQSMATLKGKVAKVIGVDVDPVVKLNPMLDEAIVYDGTHIALPDRSIDMIVSDHTFEHIPNPASFAAEVERLLKPGGWVCARTPSRYSLVSLAASLIPNRLHVRTLNRVQPDRLAEDVFPTCYKMNTRRQIDRYFARDRWENFSYTFSPGPSYHFNNRLVYRAMQAAQYLKAPFTGGEVFLVFLKRRGA